PLCKSQWRQATRRQPATEVREAVSFRSLPFPGNRNQDPQFPLRGRPRYSRTLSYQLIDKQERHPSLKVIKQLLQGRLLDLAVHRDADEAIFGLRSLQVHLRVQYAAAETRDRAGHPLQQVGAADRHGCAFKQWRAGGHRFSILAPASRNSRTAAFKL